MRLTGFMIGMALSTIAGGILWPYTIETWAGILNKPAEIVYWQGALLGFCPIIGQLTIPIAAVTWLLVLFI